MMERFLRIRDELIEVCDDDRSDLTMNRSLAFKQKVQRYCRHLQQINMVTEELQTRKLSLSHCQNALDLLVEDVQSGFSNPDSVFYRCFLKNQYISNDAEILQDRQFESGVCKIQDGRTAAMSRAEKIACQRLLLPIQESEDEASVTANSVSDYKSRLDRRKRRKIAADSCYRNCDFILGSVAEIERLWSIADIILADTRSRTTPELFEAILFLRVNSRLWDLDLVKEAIEFSK